MDPLTRQLVLHGSLVLLSGFIGGLFFARAINRAEREVAWRVVHSGATMGGVMLLALAPLASQLGVQSWAQQLVAWSFIIGTEAFVVGMYVAALYGARGLQAGGGRINLAVRLCYMVGTSLTLLGSAVLIVGAIRA